MIGIRERTGYERVRDRLQVFPNVDVEVEDYEEAAAIHSVCRAAGVSGSPVDLLVCAVAVRRGLPVFTTDNDFERYAPLCGLVLHELSLPDGDSSQR